MKGKKTIGWIVILLLLTNHIVAETAIKTSFESPQYNTGTIKNQDKWSLTSGITDVAVGNYAKTGVQGVKIAASAAALQTDFIAYGSGSAVALEGDVYVDMWIKIFSLPSQAVSFTCYDLGSSNHRSAMFELTNNGKIKPYNGSSGYTTQPSYSIGEWIRISMKIDHLALKYQIAINGQLIDAMLNFREIRNNATDLNWHSLRLAMSAGNCEMALDDLYVGNDPIEDIPFGEPIEYKTLTITPPIGATITTQPSGSKFAEGTAIEATVHPTDTYEFVSWTGDLMATENPTSFVINQNMSISAEIRPKVDPQTITLLSPTHGAILLSPNSLVHSKGSIVTATANIPDPYEFVEWTGDLSGSENPITFTIQTSLSFSASIRLKPNDTPPMCRKVRSVSEFKNALTVVNPGDTILVANGMYNMGSITFSRPGVAERPILIAAENLQGAKITGKSYFTIRKMSSITIQGFDFDVEPVSSIFKLEGSDHIRLTRNRFRMQKTSDTQSSKWIIIGDVWNNETCTSHHNRIDHNLFEDKFDNGAWVVLDGSHGTIPAISTYDRIDHNIFRNNTPRVANEKETLRLGVSDLSMKNSFCVVEYNLFEDCDGDPEFVSVKSCNNTVRYNTFRRCLGTLSLRHGNNNRVEGNYFFGENKTAEFEGGTIGCGGVRIYGLNQVIENNYMEGLTGAKWDAAITLTNGDVLNSSSSLSSHFIAENVSILHNTLVYNLSNIEIGFDNGGKYGKYPKNCKISNNIIIDNQRPIVKYYSTGALAGISFENNLFHPTATSDVGLPSYTPAQIKVEDPLLVRSNCRANGLNCDYTTAHQLYKLTPNSPAINQGSAIEVVSDMELQSSVGIRDIGADEYNGLDPILSFVMDDKNAGPFAAELSSFETLSTSVHPVEPTSTEWKTSSNPFSDFVEISCSDNRSEVLLLQMMTPEGRILLNDRVSLSPGKNHLKISLSYKGAVILLLSTKEYIQRLTLLSK